MSGFGARPVPIGSDAGRRQYLGALALGRSLCAYNDATQARADRRRRLTTRMDRAAVAATGVLEPDRSSRPLAAHTAGIGSFPTTRKVAQQLTEVIRETESQITTVAVPFAYAGRMFVVGRGAEFATAREIALKLLETCRVAAEPLTTTDLAHGPVAALDSLFPVWAIASDPPHGARSGGTAQDAGATVVPAGCSRGVQGRLVLLSPGPVTPSGRCSLSFPGSSLPGPWRRRRASAPTSRAASPGPRSPASTPSVLRPATSPRLRGSLVDRFGQAAGRRRARGRGPAPSGLRAAIAWRIARC
jgi:hypothetical protein